jgi:hypothetical protein
MLKAIPKHWFSWDFRIIDDDRDIARIDVSSWRERGVLTIDGARYGVYREGWMSGPFVLESRGSVLARAEKPSAFLRSFVIDHNGRHYTLRAQSPFRRAFVLLAGSTQVGSLAPDSVFTRRVSIDLPGDWPVAVKVFTVWLAVLLWKRNAAGSHAA